MVVHNATHVHQQDAPQLAEYMLYYAWMGIGAIFIVAILISVVAFIKENRSNKCGLNFLRIFIPVFGTIYIGLYWVVYGFSVTVPPELCATMIRAEWIVGAAFEHLNQLFWLCLYISAVPRGGWSVARATKLLILIIMALTNVTLNVLLYHRLQPFSWSFRSPSLEGTFCWAVDSNMPLDEVTAVSLLDMFVCLFTFVLFLALFQHERQSGTTSEYHVRWRLSRLRTSILIWCVTAYGLWFACITIKQNVDWTWSLYIDLILGIVFAVYAFVRCMCCLATSACLVDGTVWLCGCPFVVWPRFCRKRYLGDLDNRSRRSVGTLGSLPSMESVYPGLSRATSTTSGFMADYHDFGRVDSRYDTQDVGRVDSRYDTGYANSYVDFS